MNEIWYPISWREDIKSGYINHIKDNKKIIDFTEEEMKYLTERLELAIEDNGWVHKPNSYESYFTKDINQMMYIHIKAIIKRYCVMN